MVTVGGSPCVVSSEGPSSITCVTEAHRGPGQFEIKVAVPGKGLATTVSLPASVIYLCSYVSCCYVGAFYLFLLHFCV